MLPPLIPRHILFGNPRYASPTLSHDGRYLAYLAPDDRGVQQVWLRDRTHPTAPDRPITADRKRGIHAYHFTYDNQHLLYPQDRDGDENWHFYAVDLASSDPASSARDLTPFSGIQAHYVAQSPRRPNEQLLALNRADRRKHDFFRLDLQDGSLTADVSNSAETGHVSVWIADRNLTIRAAFRTTADGGRDLVVRSESGPWLVALHWGPEDDASLVGFHEDDRTLYLLANHNANALRLIAYDLPTGAERVLAEDPEYDVTLVHRDFRTTNPQAVGFLRDRLTWQILDDSFKPEFEACAALDRGDMNIHRSLEDQRWIVSFMKYNGPLTWHLYERATRSGQRLFAARPELEGLDLSPVQPISFTARDSLTIHGYLTLPRAVEPRDLPTVLLVHGGPWSRDIWWFNPTVQWLANRGYAVLQVNFRASRGYGKAFLNAGDREWGVKMQDDLTDAVHWAVDRGIADRQRVGIFGGSYGGYAVLAGLSFTPDLFAVGVEMYGISNLITLRQADPPTWAATKPIRDRRMGNPDDPSDRELLRSRSPLFFAGRIRAPLLIGQGANDIRVPQAESEQIADALRRRGQPVEYILYSDEGHGFVRPENRLHFFARAEQFLAKHLGGRAEPEAPIPNHSGRIVVSATG